MSLANPHATSSTLLGLAAALDKLNFLPDETHPEISTPSQNVKQVAAQIARSGS